MGLLYMAQEKTVSRKASENEKKVKLHPEELSRAKRDLLDFILQEVTKVDNFWKYRYRATVALGIGIGFESNVDVGENENGLVVAYYLKVFIPEEIWVKLAMLRKQRKFKLPKPHPIIRQRYRQMELEAESVEKEISNVIEDLETGEGDGEGA